MSNQGLFIGNVVSHWIAVVTGGAGLVGSLIEFLRKKPTPARWLFGASALLFLYASDQAWQDEHRNSTTLISEKATVSGNLSECQTSSRLQDRDATSLREVNASLTRSTDRMKGMYDSEQTLLNTQATQIGGCLVSLGKLNPALSTVYKVLLVPIYDEYKQNFPAGFQFPRLALIQTNSRATPAGVVECKEDFQLASPPSLSPDAAGGPQIVSDVPTTQLSPRKFHIQVEGNAIWNDGNPIHFFVVAPHEIDGCTFKPDR